MNDMGRMKVVLLAFSWPLAVFCQPPALNAPRIEIFLERHQGNAWRSVDPGLVLQNGDHVRFRFRANFDGYLYVMNQSTSGDLVLLFPAADTGTQNRVEAGKEYLVPATEGSFQVAGPGGHDITYWLMSSVDLNTNRNLSDSAYTPLRLPPKSTHAPPKLLPRCDDKIFRARGSCVDTSAGARSTGQSLPENIANVPSPVSRDLNFSREQNLSIVSSPVPFKGALVYEFHVAHR